MEKIKVCYTVKKDSKQDLRYVQTNPIPQDIDDYVSGVNKALEHLTGTDDRRRSKMHDRYDASVDNAPVKRKLPLNVNDIVRKSSFNVTEIKPNYERALVRRHMFFSPFPKKSQVG